MKSADVWRQLFFKKNKKNSRISSQMLPSSDLILDCPKNLDKYKARVVAKGFREVEGLD